ncbi:MAG TPA: TadE/TadG family type IV pilus assembly protein [Planctomycetaceae bacterium]|nr:TadE/TadG family type IV pilus assembly protein [Planctomycetaceae bacterium]
MKTKRPRNLKQCRRGAALVELAVCLPVLVMIILGIIEFGRGMMVSELLNDSARVGARQAILAGSTNAAVTQTITTFMQSTNVNSQAITVSITVTPAAGNPDPANQIANAHTGDLCLIQVQVPFNQVSYIPGTYLVGKTLTGTCGMLHE